MEKEKEESNAIKFALLSQKVDSIGDKVAENSSDIEEIEKNLARMSRQVNILDGGVTWVYKGIFVMTALIGAVVALIKIK